MYAPCDSTCQLQCCAKVQSTMVGTQEESTKVVVGLEKSNLNNQEVADSMKQQRKRKSLSKKTATEVQLVFMGRW